MYSQHLNARLQRHDCLFECDAYFSTDLQMLLRAIHEAVVVVQTLLRTRTHWKRSHAHPPRHSAREWLVHKHTSTQTHTTCAGSTRTPSSRASSALPDCTTPTIPCAPHDPPHFSGHPTAHSAPHPPTPRTRHTRTTSKASVRTSRRRRRVKVPPRFRRMPPPLRRTAEVPECHCAACSQRRRDDHQRWVPPGIFSNGKSACDKSQHYTCFTQDPVAVDGRYGKKGSSSLGGGTIAPTPRPSVALRHSGTPAEKAGGKGGAMSNVVSP